MSINVKNKIRKHKRKLILEANVHIHMLILEMSEVNRVNIKVKLGAMIVQNRRSKAGICI